MNKISTNDSHNSIVDIVTGELCTGCGFCVPCCPQEAITIHRDKDGFFVPYVIDEKCTKCGYCLKICPGLGLKNESYEKSSDTPFRHLIGEYMNVCVGFAEDFKIRRNGSSGGIITGLLLFLLKRKIVNGAIVVSMDDEDPLYAKAIIARSEEDVLHASGSKYTPVSMHDVVKQLMANKTDKFVFVGLPCHLEALNQVEKLTKNFSVFLKIGLYCNNTPSVNATRFVLDSLKLPTINLLNLRYRSNGWPGNLNIKFRNGMQAQIPMTEYWNSGFGQYFCRKRCVLCADQTAEFADISVADPWTLDCWTYDSIPNRRFGNSLIVVRTLKGDKILKEASEEGYISLTNIEPVKAIQYATLLKKTNKNSQSIKLLLGLKCLPYETVYSLPLTLDSFRSLFLYRINSFLAKNRRTWPLLRLSVALFSYIFSLLSHLKKHIKRSVMFLKMHLFAGNKV